MERRLGMSLPWNRLRAAAAAPLPNDILLPLPFTLSTAEDASQSSPTPEGPRYLLAIAAGIRGERVDCAGNDAVP